MHSTGLRVAIRIAIKTILDSKRNAKRATGAAIAFAMSGSSVT
jgi:hypothetical protein